MFRNRHRGIFRREYKRMSTKSTVLAPSKGDFRSAENQGKQSIKQKVLLREQNKTRLFLLLILLVFVSATRLTGIQSKIKSKRGQC
ncbi:MAG: hypothetical protein B6245_23795 [Desulfobacteraceae bacterium 4572_88]|nr:MAG: hypothetical protein B6245_23795 [Desulfobacteraceae bacterium 4572_88]